MAGDWIKMRTSFGRDGRVRKVSRSLATNVTHVCGALYLMWSLADEIAEEREDGGAFLPGYEPVDLDDHVGIEGFAEALPDEWMEIRSDGLYLPDYVEHNGATGKKRAQDQKRQKKRRQTVSGSSRTNATEKRPEKRREEKSSVPSTSEASDCTPSEASSNGSPAFDQARYQKGLEEIVAVWKRHRPRLPVNLSQRGKAYLVKAVDMEAEEGVNEKLATSVLEKRSDIETINLLLKILAEG